MSEKQVRTKKEQIFLDELETAEKKNIYLSLEKHRNELLRNFLEDYAQHMLMFRSETFDKERLELFIIEGIRKLLRNDELEFALELVRLGKEFSALSEEAVSEIVKHLSWKNEKQLRPMISALLRV